MQRQATFRRVEVSEITSFDSCEETKWECYSPVNYPLTLQYFSHARPSWTLGWERSEKERIELVFWVKEPWVS